MAIGLGIGLLCMAAADPAVTAAPVAPLDGFVLAAAAAPRTRLDFRLAVPVRDPFLVLPNQTSAERRAQRDLVLFDREAGRTGVIVRRPHMTAGLSLRMVNADGILASEIGMAGAAGRALVRLAEEAADF